MLTLCIRQLRKIKTARHSILMVVIIIGLFAFMASYFGSLAQPIPGADFYYSVGGKIPASIRADYSLKGFNQAWSANKH